MNRTWLCTESFSESRRLMRDGRNRTESSSASSFGESRLCFSREPVSSRYRGTYPHPLAGCHTAKGPFPYRAASEVVPRRLSLRLQNVADYVLRRKKTKAFLHLLPGLGSGKGRKIRRRRFRKAYLVQRTQTGKNIFRELPEEWRKLWELFNRISPQISFWHLPSCWLLWYSASSFPTLQKARYRAHSL